MILPLKSLLNRKTTVFLSVFSIALSSFLLLSIERLKESAQESFHGAVSETDLIVGARSGQLQLLLYSIFHIGQPVAGVSWKSYESIKKHPEVEWSIPISLGDSHRGHRVVGTNENYFQHFRYRNSKSLRMSSGDWNLGTYGVVLGSQVAEKFDYKLDEQIILSHGIGEVTLEDHQDRPFEVKGVLERTNTPIDKSLFISLEGMEAIHENWNSAGGLSPKQITAFLIGLKSKLGIFELQREVSSLESEALMAIIPAVSLQELWDNLFTIERLLQLIAACVAVVALLGMLTILLTSLNERRREMAILRALGAPKAYIFWIVALESFLMSLSGILGGIVLLYLGIAVGSPYLESSYGVYLDLDFLSQRELWIMLILLAAGTLAGLVPAWKAYRHSLHDGLEIRI